MDKLKSYPLRMTPEMHHAVKIEAAFANVPMRHFIESAIKAEIDRRVAARKANVER